jgi:hypothetical protein
VDHVKPGNDHSDRNLTSFCAWHGSYGDREADVAAGSDPVPTGAGGGDHDNTVRDVQIDAVAGLPDQSRE